MPGYKRDKDLEKIAQGLIEAHHPSLKHLKIACVYREEASVSDGKVTAGMCVRLDDRNRALHGHDFIIEIAKDVWDEAEPRFRQALMDHELMHVGMRLDETGAPTFDEKANRVKVYVRKHDIEEFEEILERHGDYHKDLRSFLRSFAKFKEEQKKAKREGQTLSFEDTKDDPAEDDDLNAVLLDEDDGDE